MFQTARSVVLQHVRRANLVSIELFSELDMMDIPSMDVSIERQVSDRQELRRIAELIAALPEKCRQVLILRKIYGLSQREISQKLGISENTVEKHVVKAVQFLMSSFGRGRKKSARASTSKVANALKIDGRTEKKQRDR